jgi:hypothetical protein
VIFEVVYSRAYTREVDALDLKDAARRMAAFRGAFPEGELKILSITEKKPEEVKPA